MKKGKPSQTALKVALNIIALGQVDSMKKVLPDGIVQARPQKQRRREELKSINHPK